MKKDIMGSKYQRFEVLLNISYSNDKNLSTGLSKNFNLGSGGENLMWGPQGERNITTCRPSCLFVNEEQSLKAYVR